MAERSKDSTSQEEGRSVELPNPTAWDFHSKYFRDNSIIPIKCLMTAFDIDAQKEGIRLDADIVKYLKFLIDPKNTG